MQKQVEALGGEIAQLRHANTERADRLSRYVDSVVAQAGRGSPTGGARGPGGGGGGEVASKLSELSQRVATLQTSAAERAGAAEKRIEVNSEEIREKLRRMEESRQLAAHGLKKEAEQAASAVERRATAAQEELKLRFEAYARHFDSGLASVQAAILCPPLRGFEGDPEPPADGDSPTRSKPFEKLRERPRPELTLDSQGIRQAVAADVLARVFPGPVAQVTTPSGSETTLLDASAASPRQVLSPEHSVCSP